MDKDKEKKSYLKKLHKNTLKKFLSDETSGSGGGGGSNNNNVDIEKEKSKKTKKLSKKKLALQQQQLAAQAQLASSISAQQASAKNATQQFLSGQKSKEFDDDDDDDDYDDDDSSDDDDESTSTTTTITITSPKDLYNNVVNKTRIQYSKPINFTAYSDIMQIAHDDSSHIIFVIHCVDWYFQSRYLVSNVEQLFSKDKHTLYFFINQSDQEYKKDFPGEIAGVPIISIYYRQKPFKIKRDTIQYDWGEEERIKASLTIHQLKELVDQCKQSIESFHPDENIEISIDF